METAKVKRYEVLYTTHVKKKQKTWKDGALRHHHYNSKMYLLAEDGAVLAESFYRPPAGGSKQRFADDFVLDGEVEFESGFLVEVGDVVWEGTTNLTDIKTATKEARSKAAEVAHAWAASEAASESSPRPSASSSSRAQAVTAFYDSPSTGKGKQSAHGQLAPIAVNGSTYRGFGIAPPQSYCGGKQSAAKSRSSSAKGSSLPAPSRPSAAHASSPKPYARPSPAAGRPSPHERLASLTGESLSSPGPLPRPGPSTTPMVGTPSRATASPFKAPRPRGAGGPPSALAR